MTSLQKGKYLILGMVIAVVVGQLTVPALAALTGKTITAYTGINVYMDDVRLAMTDVNGNAVEAFAYNGTTYLPVRAVANAFDTAISWDGLSQSVYIGRHSSDRPALYLQDLDWFTGWDVSVVPSAMDNLGNTRLSVIRNGMDNVYKINGKYSKIDGYFFQEYDYRNNPVKSTFSIYGDGRVLYSAEMAGGMEPVYFNVDLRGVLELRVKFDISSARLSEVGLWQ